MATILLNGVLTNASTLTGTDLADKLTVSGGVDGIEANLLDADDLIEVEANGEDSDATLRGGEGDDVINVTAGNPEEIDFVTPQNISGSLIGGPGADTIAMGDGLAVLTGTIKGNEDDDTITLANADGGFVQGNSGDDTITLGFGAGYGTAAGSRAVASFTDASINGSGGDDTINIDDVVSLTDTTVRGNEGDDIITADSATASGSVAIEGNAGDERR